jgi:kynurenine formamidase
VLEPASGVTARDLALAAGRAGAEPQAGDVALVRTGWASYFPDAQRYVRRESGVPGVTEDGARWLAERGVIATGADTTAYERIPRARGTGCFPCTGCC